MTGNEFDTEPIAPLQTTNFVGVEDGWTVMERLLTRRFGDRWEIDIEFVFQVCVWSWWFRRVLSRRCRIHLPNKSVMVYREIQFGVGLLPTGKKEKLCKSILMPNYKQVNYMYFFVSPFENKIYIWCLSSRNELYSLTVLCSQKQRLLL